MPGYVRHSSPNETPPPNEPSSTTTGEEVPPVPPIVDQPQANVDCGRIEAKGSAHVDSQTGRVDSVNSSGYYSANMRSEWATGPTSSEFFSGQNLHLNDRGRFATSSNYINSNSLCENDETSVQIRNSILLGI